ncbi:hypothetical protein OUZ56_016251 [Daphnia magna]|uniref:Uncharacterized protein n=1 Tax=Daphnia magna TaxID=35525 RepID=A0ABR0AQ39_9CRUS|nr:hypothetical protein OUZ56_016251 [Daphnia magna]
MEYVVSQCQLHLTSLKQQVIMPILKMFSIYKLLQLSCCPNCGPFLMSTSQLLQQLVFMVT